jgi:hypothetical protein
MTERAVRSSKQCPTNFSCRGRTHQPWQIRDDKLKFVGHHLRHNHVSFQAAAIAVSKTDPDFSRGGHNEIPNRTSVLDSVNLDIKLHQDHGPGWKIIYDAATSSNRKETEGY